MLLALDQGRPDRFDGLQSIDFGAVVLYFIVMLIAGYYFSKRQKSTEEYFMAGRSMPWFVVGVSMFATLLSTVSYLSSPGEIIKNGLGIWGGQMHIPFTLALVTLVLIPFFMRKRFTSAYEYLEAQYGLGARLFASILFMLNRLFWMGMIVYTASFAMVRMTGLPFIWVVVGIGSIAIVYTTMGGMRAVIWTDVAQFAILFAGLAFTVGFVFFETGTGPATWFNDVMQAEREPQPFFAFDPYVRVSLLGMAIYAMFWWTCTAGSDQVAIQRYLTTGSVGGARRSFASNLGADMTIALSLGLTGMALYSFYLGQLPGTPDQAFPHFHRPRHASGTGRPGGGGVVLGRHVEPGLGDARRGHGVDRRLLPPPSQEGPRRGGGVEAGSGDHDSGGPVRHLASASISIPFPKRPGATSSISPFGSAATSPEHWAGCSLRPS